MKNRKSTSFTVFIIAAITTALVFIAAILFSIYDVDLKYSMVLALFMFLAFVLSAFGIYIGFKNKTHQKNKLLNQLGLIGNLLIYFFMIVVIAMVALSKVSE